MPTVPTFTDQQLQGEQLNALPTERVSTDASAEAFGGGDSAKALGNASQGMFDAVNKIATDAKAQADQVAHMQADAAASDLQTKIQLKVANMKGQDAFGAPDVAQQDWQDGINDISNGLTNKTQQLAFQRSASQRWMELNKSTQIHVNDQANAFDDQQTQSYVDTSRNAAVVNAGDDDKVQAELDRTKAVIQDWAQRKGVAGTVVEQKKLLDETSATHRDVIQARLDSGIDDGAQDYFDAHKDEMAAPDVLAVQKALENNQIIQEGNDVWDKTRGIKFADGTLNIEAMRKAVSDNSDLSPERQEKVEKYVVARAKEYNTDRIRGVAENERSFMNDLIQTRQGGAPLDTAMRLVDQYGTDPYDSAMKTKAIQDTYAPPSQSDPGTFISLWERNQDGTATKQDIDQAYNTGKINTTDWRAQREMLYKNQTDGTDPQTKNAWDRVKLLADQQIGNNKQDREAFLYDLHTQAGNKSPAEIIKMANDKLKNDPTTGTWGFFQDPQYKSDVQKIDANNLAWGTVHDKVGQQQTEAIRAAVRYSDPENRTPGIGDVQNYANQFGGFDNLKLGTPTNNAIQSLRLKQLPATKANVDAVLAKYKDGNF